MILKFQEPITPKGCLRFLIRYKEHKDQESKWLKIWCSSAAFLYQFMDFNTQDNKVLPTTSNDDVAKDEFMNVGSLEVVGYACADIRSVT